MDEQNLVKIRNRLLTMQQEIGDSSRPFSTHEAVALTKILVDLIDNLRGRPQDLIAPEFTAP